MARQAIIDAIPRATFTAGVTGLEPTHPLFASVEDVVWARQAQL